MTNNYYMASKAIIPPGYYETVVSNANKTDSIIVVNDEGCIPKIKKAAEKIGIDLKYNPITIDEYVYQKCKKGNENDNSK